MRNLGYPDKIVRILENLYHGTFSIVRVRADTTNWFETIVGLLQGCILSPLLFKIFLKVIVSRALQDMNLVAVMNGYVINNLRFADDIAATAENQQKLQLIVDNIVAESTRMGMKVNIEKTEVQHVGLVEKEVIILIENQTLKQVKDFGYLGGNISDDASTEQDVKRRIGCACGIMQNLSLEMKRDKQRNQDKNL
jgi:Reverse transcriptase (RNA-dependent DNA polymerase)